MKIIKLKLIHPRIKFDDNSGLELHEEKTIHLLKKYGFLVKTITPTNIPKMNNPDILLDGVIWEMKAPFRYNENTLNIRMKKAAKQAGRVVFDLRNLTKDLDRAEKYIVKLFNGNTNVRRMIIIRDDKNVFEYFK